MSTSAMMARRRRTCSISMTIAVRNHRSLWSWLRIDAELRLCKPGTFAARFALSREEEISMPQVSPDVTRPMVKVLFVATCLLSIVSWYTTEQGMALYLSVWFALLASL